MSATNHYIHIIFSFCLSNTLKSSIYRLFEKLDIPYAISNYSSIYDNSFIQLVLICGVSFPHKIKNICNKSAVTPTKNIQIQVRGCSCKKLIRNVIAIMFRFGNIYVRPQEINHSNLISPIIITGCLLTLESKTLIFELCRFTPQQVIRCGMTFQTLSKKSQRTMGFSFSPTKERYITLHLKKNYIPTSGPLATS
ncbi:hypothetical protein FRX31_017185 [Thalictrum thalictroides]|uniref:Uncharacterized protein n=1 Tax=Thalictrum thalictroides TaxID=46969 RepID=A0A7J6W8B4_THATH|nr:hypothetical protein FRX31_017185 [Thalictrum thalictroides]